MSLASPSSCRSVLRSSLGALHSAVTPCPLAASRCTLPVLPPPFSPLHPSSIFFLKHSSNRITPPVPNSRGAPRPSRIGPNPSVQAPLPSDLLQHPHPHFPSKPQLCQPPLLSPQASRASSCRQLCLPFLPHPLPQPTLFSAHTKALCRSSLCL